MSFAMQEPEPLRLRNEYPPLKPRDSQLPTLEGRPGGRRPSHDKEERRRIAMKVGRAQDIAAELGLSTSYVFTCRREFQRERDAAGLSGGKPAYRYDERRRIALMDGLSQRAIAKQFGISPATLWAYRKEFQAERIAAGLDSHEETYTRQAKQADSERLGTRVIEDHLL